MINYRTLLFLLLLCPFQNSYSNNNNSIPSCEISAQESAYLLNQIVLGNKALIASLDDCKKNNRFFISKLIETDPNYFEFASEFLRDDEVFIGKFVAINPQILKYISNRLAGDEFFMFKMAKIYPEAIEYASPQLTDNKNFITKMIALNSKNFIYASDRLQNDRAVVLLAVRKNGKMLRFASDKLQDDSEIVVEAVKSYNLAIEFASEKLQKDEKIKKIANSIDYSFLANFHQPLKDNYGGLAVGPNGYRGYHIVNMAKNFSKNQIVYQPYLTKWQRVYKNGVNKGEFELVSNAKSHLHKNDKISDWKSVFSKYQGLAAAIEKIFADNHVDKNSVDALNLESFWAVSTKPKILVFNLYLLRQIDDVYLGSDVANIISLTAIARETKAKKWEIDVVDAIFDANLGMSISYKNGHKKYKIWDLYQENKRDKNLKILFKVEDKDGEYFDLFAKQINGSYSSIYKGGGYDMEINVLNPS